MYICFAFMYLFFDVHMMFTKAFPSTNCPKNLCRHLQLSLMPKNGRDSLRHHLFSSFIFLNICIFFVCPSGLYVLNVLLRFYLFLTFKQAKRKQNSTPMQALKRLEHVSKISTYVNSSCVHMLYCA